MGKSAVHDRQEKRWQDAMGVVKQHENATNELQFAIHWATDIAGAPGIQKLQQLWRAEEALLYCCENGITELATLLMSTCKSLPLDDSTGAPQVRDCSRSAAQIRRGRSAFHRRPSTLPEAIQVYSDNEVWADAQCFAAKYGITDMAVAPMKGSASLSKTDGLSGVTEAMGFEEQRQYNEAITAYLSRTAADCGGEDRLDQVLERLVKLFAIFFSGLLRDVVTNVAQILIGMNRHASLGKILKNIEEYADSFEIYKLTETLDDANRLSTYVDPQDEAAFQR
jgi:hypothetical protein